MTTSISIHSSGSHRQPPLGETEAVIHPTATSAADLDRVAAAIQSHRGEPGALMPMLHAVQDALGHIPDDVVPMLADATSRSRAEVHGVVSYYHHFRRTPAGRHIVQVCVAESCKSCGADALLAHVEARLGCSTHETSADGKVSLEPVYCLGLCASSPAIQIDDRLHARMTAQRFDRLAAALEDAQ